MEATTDITTIKQIIKERRSIFPHAYTGEKIADELITEILEQANYAPTHRLTEPWRFKVITGKKLGELGDLLANLYKEKTKDAGFSEMKFNKTAQKPRLCSHVIAICMQRDKEERIPEWEEVASVAMTVQNMWLAASACGIGAYWSSPSTVEQEAFRKFLGLAEGQRCLGVFYMGYHEQGVQEAKRTPMADKVEWL